MFNTLCYYLNFITPALPATLRRLAYHTLPTRPWRYSAPTAGYVGGVDTWLGTVCFEDEQGVVTFRW